VERAAFGVTRWSFEKRMLRDGFLNPQQPSEYRSMSEYGSLSGERGGTGVLLNNEGVERLGVFGYQRGNVKPYVPWAVGHARDPVESDLWSRLSESDYLHLLEDPQGQVDETIRCELDPWYWIMNYVWTNDEHWVMKGKHGAYQRFPAKRHLREYAGHLFRERYTAWPKDRQQMITWLVSTWILGDALFTGGRLYMIQSKREADSQKVLSRMIGVYERMKVAAPWLGPGWKRVNSGEVAFENGSIVMAVPEGPHYVQSHTPAWLFADEAQLQDSMAEAYYQALPACERVTLVGSVDYGWFCQDFLAGK
jgi:hypothetical protein